MSILRRLSVGAVVFVFTCSLILPSAAQSVLLDSAADRKERIAENLKLRFDQLYEAEVEVTELAEAGITGFDEGTVLINGRNAMRFLVTRDDKHLYLLAADAVDVSMTTEEVAAERQRLALEEMAAARQRHAELMALSAGKPSRGQKDAPVTIVEFSDFQCPYCARVVPTVEQVLKKYPQDVRLVFMHLPLSIHPWAESAAVAATCAGRQSPAAFWKLHDSYFENQGTVTPETVISKSREWLAGSGLDIGAWDRCSDDKDSAEHLEVLTEVRASVATASKYGATGTPAFFVNGRFISGAQPLSAFDELIKEVLKEDA